MPRVPRGASIREATSAEQPRNRTGRAETRGREQPVNREVVFISRGGVSYISGVSQEGT